MEENLNHVTLARSTLLLLTLTSSGVVQTAGVEDTSLPESVSEYTAACQVLYKESLDGVLGSASRAGVVGLRIQAAWSQVRFAEFSSANAFVDAIARLSMLEELVRTNDGIFGDIAQLLIPVFQKLGRLKRMDLPRNHIYKQDNKAIRCEANTAP